MKLVEYDRLARRPCRGRAAGVDHLSDVRVTSAQQAETPSTDPYLLRRSHRTLAVTRTASGRASTADPGGNSGRSPRSVREVHAHPAVTHPCPAREVKQPDCQILKHAAGTKQY